MRAIWLLLPLLGAACGRIGLELRPLPPDGGEPEPDGGELDAGADDAGPDDAEAHDADAQSPALVDGCVVSETGTCASCDSTYPDAGFQCGVGYCRTASTPTSCKDGVEIACVPGSPRAATDVTCDGVDDDCSGVSDEEYVGETSSCGTGVCARTGTLMCTAGSAVDSCAAAMPMTMADDATGAGNGLDDDCDGRIDEDVSACDTTPLRFEAGVHMNIPVPAGCGTATVQLWGGAGAAGGEAGIGPGFVRPGGRGGSGGYARSMLTLTGPLTLYIGNGGAAGCNEGGANSGASSYSGGRGGINEGAPGADGVVAGGGAGARNLIGNDGGRGHFGGGGGGASQFDAINGLLPSPGGGGGAASVLLMNGQQVMVAGGGGGGGGAAALVWNFGEVGGNGGEGCSGAGTAGESPRTGGGGGGGVCLGMTTSVGTNGRPANSSSVPVPRARSTDMNCSAGGNGYGIVTFAR